MLSLILFVDALLGVCGLSIDGLGAREARPAQAGRLAWQARHCVRPAAKAAVSTRSALQAQFSMMPFSI
jgi:hypothetical protein